jgi:hypothetical protein
MVFHMNSKTTLTIDERLMREVKAEAARRGVTMSELVTRRTVTRRSTPSAESNWSSGEPVPRPGT